MLTALARSIAQLADPPVLRVFLKTIALTLAIFAAAGFGLWWGLSRGFEWLGWRQSGGFAAAALAAVVAILAFWLLFRAVAVAVVGVFGDEIVIAVERRHFRQALASARNVPLGRSIAMGLGSAGRALLGNVLALPLYLLLLPTGPGAAVPFFLVNGWLLGRDLGDMVAARHMPRAALMGWRAETRGSRLLLGLVVTGLFVIPIVNLVAPVIGAALATHRFHRSKT